MTHDHSNPERMAMKATRKDVEQLVANCNADPRARGAKTVLKDHTITITCADCNQPIAVIDVEFTEAIDE